MLAIAVSLASYFFCNQLGSAGEQLPFGSLHNAPLQAFGTILFIYGDGALQYNLAAVRYFIYKVDCCTAHLNALFQRGLMHAKSIVALAAKRGDERRMHVYNALLPLGNKFRREN